MIDYTDDIWVLCKRDGSVMPEAILQTLPGSVFALILCILHDRWPAMQEESGWGGLNIVGLTWNAMTLCLGILMTLRIKQSLGRFWEGTSLLHQMRGEWFDAASCLISFSRDAKMNKGMRKDVEEFRDTLIRLMSLMHGSALDEISGSDVSYEVIDVGGLDTPTLLFLRDCQKRCNFSKVEALQHLIQVLVTDNHHKGVLSIPAPILSRTYQTLSRGFVNLLNARKIKDTSFPFPFVQTIRFLLVVHTFVTPAVMTTVLNSSFWAILFTFVPLFGLHCLNLTAQQLEMPFGADANDLPLAQFQSEMNDTLLMLISEGSDHCPMSSSTAVPLAEFDTSFEVGHSRTVERQSFFMNREASESLGDKLSVPLSLRRTLSSGNVVVGAPWTHRWLQAQSLTKGSSNTRTFLEKSFFSEKDSFCETPQYEEQKESTPRQFDSIEISSLAVTSPRRYSRDSSSTSRTSHAVSFVSGQGPEKMKSSHNLPTIRSSELVGTIGLPHTRATPVAESSEVKNVQPRSENQGKSRTPMFSFVQTPLSTPKHSPSLSLLGVVGFDRPAVDPNVEDLH